MAEDAVQLIEGAVTQHQLTLTLGGVLDLHLGPQALGKVVL